MKKMPRRQTELRKVSWGVAAPGASELLTKLARARLGRDAAWVLLASAKLDALLVGSGEADDELAREVATAIGSAYLLDFHDEAASTRRFDAGAKREKWLRSHPAGFLRDHGIVAPGWEPRTTPVRSVEIVEGVAPEKVRKVFARDGMQFIAHSRGTLVLGDPGPGTFKYAAKLKTNVLSVLHNTRSGAFYCTTIRPNGSMQGCFIGEFANLEMYDVVESVFGATTPLEICKTLEIDPALLGLSQEWRRTGGPVRDVQRRSLRLGGTLGRTCPRLRSGPFTFVFTKTKALSPWGRRRDREAWLDLP